MTRLFMMTEAQHAQAVDALALPSLKTVLMLIERDAAFEMLKSMQPVSPVAYRNPTDTYSIVTLHQKETNELQYSDEFLAAHTVPLYTPEQSK